MTMFLHYRCAKPCTKLWGLRVSDEECEHRLSLKSTQDLPTCRACGKRLNATGRGAKKLAKGAIEMTQTSFARMDGKNKRAAVINRKRFPDPIDSDDDDDDQVGTADDDDDDDFAPTPDHAYNIRMRLTPAPYSGRASCTSDSSLTLKVRRQIQATAGRLDLNKVMGKHFKKPSPSAYPAWKHAGTTSYKKDKFSSSEWCHLVADSLGGPSDSSNLVAASFSANTYMAALEALLKGQTGLMVDVTVLCSFDHIADMIVYRLEDRHSSSRAFEAKIDGAASGFSASDLSTVQRDLQSWLKTCGIDVKLSA